MIKNIISLKLKVLQGPLRERIDKLEVENKTLRENLEQAKNHLNTTKNFNEETADTEIETSGFQSKIKNLALESPVNFEKSTQTAPGDPQKESVDDQIMKLEGKKKMFLKGCDLFLTKDF